MMQYHFATFYLVSFELLHEKVNKVGVCHEKTQKTIYRDLQCFLKGRIQVRGTGVDM